MFQILIHADLYRVLRESKRELRSRVRKTLLRLKDGHWNGGTRVKRLRGVNKPVFEARTDRGDRLLFTAIRSADAVSPDRMSTHLQVWDMVSHDAVDRVARRNKSAEAEFLEFKVEEQFEIQEPPPAPEATLDAIAAEDGTDPLLHFLLPPDDFTTKAEEGITGAVRWFQTPASMLANDDEFQRIIDHDGSGLELKLTREQYQVLLAPGPALVAGSAGSGKTTIAIHRLADAASASPPLRALYLSYSPWLVDHARNLYKDVIVARGAAGSQHPPQFATFPDLYRRIAPIDGSLIDVVAFRLWFSRSALRLDAALVWEEIRSILKGACTNLGKPMLNEAEYLELGRKRAPLFVTERPEIYKIALRYQQWLSQQKRLDQIDLCRRAFLELRHGHHKRYDVVVCDESQDLTEIEIAFVLNLSSDASFERVMLSGDTQQIVNPSGFRWAEVRQSILKATRGTKAPQLLRLRRNFRSVRPIVDLANSVLALRRDIYGRTDEDDAEEAALEGPTPIQILDADKQVLDAIRGFGPRCAVLVFSEQDRELLQRELDSTRIFHIQEAKGLEFDTIVLWKVLGADPVLFDRFIRADQKLERDARFRLFLQHLYVAVTRARRHVAVFEGSEAHPFWNSGRLRNRPDHAAAAALARLFRESASPKDWIKEAGYYLERQRYRQAAECFRRGGQVERENEAMAMFAESIEDWIGALKRWQHAGNLERQAPLLEKMSRLPEALEIYQQLGLTEKAVTIEIQLLEKQGRWAEAGQRWEAQGRMDDAARCYHKSGNRARALSFEAVRAEGEKDWTRAAECWFEIQSWESAARCYLKAKDKVNAALATARQAEAVRDWAAASTAFRRAGDRPKADRCRARALEVSGRADQAAKLWERLNETDEALRLYRSIGNTDAVDRLEFAKLNVHEDQLRKVCAFEMSGKLQMAIRLASARRSILNTQLRKRLPALRQEELWNEHDDLQEAESRCRAKLAERSEDWRKAAYHWRRAHDEKRAHEFDIKLTEGMTNPAERAREWLRIGEWTRAAESFAEAGDVRSQQTVQARYLERLGDWAGSAELWRKLDQPYEAARCMEQIQLKENPNPQKALFAEHEYF